jgi:hypothetical protein
MKIETDVVCTGLGTSPWHSTGHHVSQEKQNEAISTKKVISHR